MQMCIFFDTTFLVCQCLTKVTRAQNVVQKPGVCCMVRYFKKGKNLSIEENPNKLLHNF